MGVAHILYVRNQLVRQLGVVVRDAVRFHLPAAGMQLINEHRPVDHIALLLFFLPGGVAPGKAADVIDLAAVGRAGFGMEGIRVRLVNQLVRRCGHAELVHIKLLDAGNEKFPDSVVHLFHRVCRGHPVVKIAHHRNSLCMRGPQPEHNARLSILLAKVCTEVAICFHIISLPEQINRQVGRFWHLFLLFQFDLPLQNHACMNPF